MFGIDLSSALELRRKHLQLLLLHRAACNHRQSQPNWIFGLDHQPRSTAITIENDGHLTSQSEDP